MSRNVKRFVWSYSAPGVLSGTLYSSFASNDKGEMSTTSGPGLSSSLNGSRCVVQSPTLFGPVFPPLFRPGPLPSGFPWSRSSQERKKTVTGVLSGTENRLRSLFGSRPCPLSDRCTTQWFARPSPSPTNDNRVREPRCRELEGGYGSPSVDPTHPRLSTRGSLVVSFRPGPDLRNFGVKFV